MINRSTIQHCVDLLLRLSDSSYDTTVYRRCLEPQILHKSCAYYSAEAGRLRVTCGALEYLRRVNPLSLLLVYLVLFCEVRFEHGSSRSRTLCSTCHHRPYRFFWLFSRMLSSNSTYEYSLTRSAHFWMTSSMTRNLTTFLSYISFNGPC